MMAPARRAKALEKLAIMSHPLQHGKANIR
jgi:hypothetical protein